MRSFDPFAGSKLDRVPQVGVLADLCATSAETAPVCSENAAGSAGSARPTSHSPAGRALPAGLSGIACAAQLRGLSENRDLWHPIKKPKLACFVIVQIAAMLVGCGQPSKQTGAPPPPSVSVTHPIRRAVIEWDEYTGRLSSPETANISARVSGLIVQTPFKEGSMVRKGDLLFVIDDRPYKADLESKEADLARAKAQLELAGTNLKRLEKIKTSRAISESDYDTAVANNQQANAAVAAAQAALNNSQLYLDWTRVTAPIDGRVSRQYVTTGNLVNGGSGQATLLTSITSVDPMYCYVSVPERAYLRYQALAAQRQKQAIPDARIPCYIQLENETTFPHEGVIDFTDNQVDPGTGTIQIRGVLPNHQNVLTPGLFARMRVPGSARYEALLVPDKAISTQQNEQFILVAGPNDIVQSKTIRPGALFGSVRAIVQGLNADDRVIIDGLQQARPGTKVNPHEVPPATDLPDLGGAGAPMAGTGAAQGTATQPAAPTTQSPSGPSTEAKP